VKHARIIDRQPCEPLFEPPPRFLGIHDRRLGGRVAAEWRGHASGEALPAGTLHAAIVAGGANLVWLDDRDDVVAVTVGATVAEVFGLRPAPLPVDGAFACALRAATVRCRADAAPAHFEGGFARRPGDPVTLLTRGTVVPLTAGEGGATACVVLTWTETLAPAASDRLRRDLLAALAVPVPVRSARPVAIW